jgi:hypothetical protein
MYPDRTKEKANKALHRTTFPLRSKTTGELVVILTFNSYSSISEYGLQ